MRNVTCQCGGLHWQTQGLTHRGKLPGFPRGCRLPATSSLPNTQHPTQVTHLMSCVGCDGYSGGHRTPLSGKSPKPQGHTGTPLLGTDSQSQLLSWIQCWLKNVKTKALPSFQGKGGGWNMQKGFCLCSPLSGRLLGVKGGELWPLKTCKEHGRCSTKAWGRDWGAGGGERKTLRHWCLGWLPPGLQSSSICLAVLTLADSHSLPHRRAPRNQPGGAEATCLATSFVLVT